MSWDCTWYQMPSYPDNATELTHVNLIYGGMLTIWPVMQVHSAFKLEHNARKPSFTVSDQVKHKSACWATRPGAEIHWRVFKYITVTFTDQWLQLHYNYRTCRNVMITITLEM